MDSAGQIPTVKPTVSPPPGQGLPQRKDPREKAQRPQPAAVQSSCVTEGIFSPGAMYLRTPGAGFKSPLCGMSSSSLFAFPGFSPLLQNQRVGPNATLGAKCPLSSSSFSTVPHQVWKNYWFSLERPSCCLEAGTQICRQHSSLQLP